MAAGVGCERLAAQLGTPSRQTLQELRVPGHEPPLFRDVLERDACTGMFVIMAVSLKEIWVISASAAIQKVDLEIFLRAFVLALTNLQA